MPPDTATEHELLQWARANLNSILSARYARAAIEMKGKLDEVRRELERTAKVMNRELSTGTFTQIRSNNDRC